MRIIEEAVKSIAIIQIVPMVRQATEMREAHMIYQLTGVRKGQGSIITKENLCECEICLKHSPHTNLNVANGRIVKEKGSRRGCQFHEIGAGVCEPM